MSVIEVVPDEIRYWLASSLPVPVQEVASTVQGKVTVPGELRTITRAEVSALEAILVGRILTDPLAPRSKVLRKQVQKQNSGCHIKYCYLYLLLYKYPRIQAKYKLDSKSRRHTTY